MKTFIFFFQFLLFSLMPLSCTKTTNEPRTDNKQVANLPTAFIGTYHDPQKDNGVNSYIEQQGDKLVMYGTHNGKKTQQDVVITESEASILQNQLYGAKIVGDKALRLTSNITGNTVYFVKVRKLNNNADNIFALLQDGRVTYYNKIN